MEDDHRCNEANPTSFKNKLKQSICSSCCFGRRRSSHHSASPPSCPVVSDDNPALIWVQTNDHDGFGRPHAVFSVVMDKCRSVLGIAKHKKCPSADFRYDPLSYALNFEEEGCDLDDDTAPLRNFSARLPPSPTVTTVVV